MQYLRCLYVFFLFFGIILCIKATVKDFSKGTKWQEKLMSNVLIWILGSFWFFLLLKFFGIKI